MRGAKAFFWIALVALVAWDWGRSRPIDRFDEPPVIAAGSGRVAAAGHCANVPR